MFITCMIAACFLQEKDYFSNVQITNGFRLWLNCYEHQMGKYHIYAATCATGFDNFAHELKIIFFYFNFSYLAKHYFTFNQNHSICMASNYLRVPFETHTNISYTINKLKSKKVISNIMHRSCYQ